MRIHIVSGFLGSGKTTAIANAAQQLTSRDVTTGVITNDQGKYLVDSRFISLTNVAQGEVTGGCFCCNYNLLDDQITLLKKKVKPKVMFAESVGSCTDLMATVVKPLTKFRGDELEAVTFSGFVDSRLLLRHLKGEELPFNAETNYIWKKQIEEAEILVVNKVDLLCQADTKELHELATRRYSSKTVIFQNSLDEFSVRAWLDVLGSHTPKEERRVIDVDYATYGAGEANLAWLDEEIGITTTSQSAVAGALSFIQAVTSTIEMKRFPVGHLKFLVTTPFESVKISFTTVDGNDWRTVVTLQESHSVRLMVNARIQSSPEELRSIVAAAVDRLKRTADLQLEEDNVSYFQPGVPNPTHRFSN